MISILMYQDIFSSILMILSSFLIGSSIGLGFNPYYKQPKNIRVQILLSIIGFIYPIIYVIQTWK